MSTNKSRKYIPIYLDDEVHTQIHVYAVETHQTIQDVVKPIAEDCKQSILKLIAQVREMKRAADIERLKQEEASSLSEENTFNVPGYKNDEDSLLK